MVKGNTGAFVNAASTADPSAMAGLRRRYGGDALRQAAFLRQVGDSWCVAKTFGQDRSIDRCLQWFGRVGLLAEVRAVFDRMRARERRNAS